jgi:hypothetical protein
LIKLKTYKNKILYNNIIMDSKNLDLIVEPVTDMLHENRVVLESHIFRTLRMVNRKEDIGFSAYWYLLCEVILNGKYSEDIKLLIKAMQAIMVCHKIVTHADSDIVELKKQSQEYETNKNKTSNK